VKLKSVLSIAVALIVAVVIVPFVWKIVQEKNNDRLISNWKVCDVAPQWRHGKARMAEETLYQPTAD